MGEAHDGAQCDGVVAFGEVAQDAAGGDRRQLLVVADEAHAGAASQRVGDEGVEVAVEAMPASSTMSRVSELMRSNHRRAGIGGRWVAPVVPVSWTSLAMVSVGRPSVFGENFGRAGGGGERR